MSAHNLLLYPNPRILEVHGQGAPAGTIPRLEVDHNLRPQGFEIVITRDKVAIRYRDEAGHRYGMSILNQIRSQTTCHYPRCRILDWPDFAVRGYMIDISRDRVPTRDSLERLVEVLTLARVNHLQLYMEHAFSYRRHRAVWHDADPLTPEDIGWLDRKCVSHGIELVANQNTFGHMERWLQHDTYRHYGEVQRCTEIVPGLKIPPSVLAPTGQSRKFVEDLLDELLSNFGSRRVHIGCDEVFELGLGASSEAVKCRGKQAVFLEHVLSIGRPLLDKGYEVLLWDDMVRHHPEMVARLPEKMIPIVWWYEAPTSPDLLPDVPNDVANAAEKYGIHGLKSALRSKYAAGFTEVCASLADAGTPFWIAPGTSTWNSLIGRYDNATANLLDAAQTGLRRGARGYLITDWGDGGHWQPPSISFGPIVYGGAVSWCADTNRNMDTARVLDELVFLDDRRVLGSLLSDIGGVWKDTGYRLQGASPLHIGLCLHKLGNRRWGLKPIAGRGDPVAISRIIETLTAALSSLDSASPKCVDSDLAALELDAAIRLARHGAWRLLKHLDACSLSRSELRRDFQDAVKTQREAWLGRSRPGGLEESLRRLHEDTSALA